MKIYVLTKGCYSDYHNIAGFREVKEDEEVRLYHNDELVGYFRQCLDKQNGLVHCESCHDPDCPNKN